MIISDDSNDKYIYDIDIPHIIYKPEKIIKNKWWIRHHNPYNDYFNQVLDVIPDGNFVIYLDDDDLLLDKYWIKKILDENTDVLIGKFQMGKNHDYKTIGEQIKRGKIGGSCFSVRSEIARQNKWPSKGGGDFMFIKKISEKYNVKFIDHIVAGVQDNLSRSWRRKK